MSVEVTSYEAGINGFCVHCGRARYLHGPLPFVLCPNQSKRDHPEDPPQGVIPERLLRQFDTGATRNLDSNKFDYEAFISPVVLHRYAEYMHAHRKQKDGTLRDGDDWQKGMPQSVYLKSLIRHTMDFWLVQRGGIAVDPDSGKPAQAEDLACAIMFNIMGWLHAVLTNNTKQKGATQ